MMLIESVLTFLVTIVAVQCVMLETDEGFVKGKYLRSNNGKKFTGFIGIPYAEPPIGPLRFKPPVPKIPWNGVRESLDKVNICPQIDMLKDLTSVVGDEDCLYLNVFTPKMEEQSLDYNLLPVMVFIHGGSFASGHANIYGPEVLLDKDVVLVVINYRLGALGFFTTGDDIVSGNNGLKDQVLALQWVKKNIRAFGGNPNSITIFGESAGASSVHFHTLSPLSKGLFHRGISQSGTALALWTFNPRDEAIKTCKKLAEAFNCPSSNSTEMVECLRQQETCDFVKFRFKFMRWIESPSVVFKPTAEHEHSGAFLTQHPIHYITSGQVENIPWINGISANEGALMLSMFIGNPQLFDQFSKDFTSIVPINIGYEHFVNDVNGTTNKLKEFYFNNEISNDKVENITNLFTDGHYTSTVDASLRLHLKYTHQPTYYYFFNYRGEYSLTEFFTNSTTNYGVGHSDILFYLFQIRNLTNDNDRQMSEALTNIWYDFANGRDLSEKSDSGIQWNKVTSEDAMEYLRIDGPHNIKMENGVYLDRLKFWRPILDEIINKFG